MKIPFPRPTDKTGGLPLVHLECMLGLPSKEDVNYTITGLTDEWFKEFIEDVLPPGENRIVSTFHFDLSGPVISPKEWKGCNCNLTVNRSSISYEEGKSDIGYIGEGWYEPSKKSVVVLLTIKPQMVRELLDLWGGLSRLNEDDAPRQNFVSASCDLVHVELSVPIRL